MAGGTARADAQEGIAIDVSTCDRIDAGEVTRLLHLELSTLIGTSGTVPSLVVVLECEEAGAIRIRVADPVTDKVVERRIPAPNPTDPGAERIVALSTAQLVLASWLEVLLPARKEASPEPAAGDAGDRAIARHAATRALPTARTRTDFEPSAIAGVRVRDSASPFALWHTGVGLGAWLGRQWGLFAEVGLEMGSSERERGEIAATLAGGRAGACIRPWRAGPLALEGRASLGASYLRLEGTPSRPGGVGSSITAGAGEVRGELGPASHIGPVRVAAVGEGGVLFGAPDGKVYQDTSVSVAGPWFGGSLRIGLGL
jgi:hypothetical protein